jgi:CheY-specific phosphatase CheX
MTDFQRDILIGLMFIIGIFGFISGEFIISTVVFALAAIFSNMVLSRRLHDYQK